MIPVFLLLVSKYLIHLETENDNRKTGIMEQQETTAIWIPWLKNYSSFPRFIIWDFPWKS